MVISVLNMLPASTKTAHIVRALRTSGIKVSIARDRYVAGSGVFPMINGTGSRTIFQYNANDNIFSIPDLGAKLVVDRGLLDDDPYGIFCNSVKLLKSTLLLVEEINNEKQTNE
jgi:hypothetical protein